MHIHIDEYAVVGTIYCCTLRSPVIPVKKQTKKSNANKKGNHCGVRPTMHNTCRWARVLVPAVRPEEAQKRATLILASPTVQQ